MGYIIFKIFNDIVLGYTLSTLVLIVIFKLSRHFRPLKFHYLNTANYLICIISILFYIGYCITFFRNSNVMKLDISSDSYRIESLLFTSVATFLVPLLFLFKKLRHNFIIISLVMLSLVIFTNYEKAIILITNFYRDYLPSSWSVEYPSLSYVNIGLAGLVYFIFVVLIIRINK